MKNPAVFCLSLFALTFVFSCSKEDPVIPDPVTPAAEVRAGQYDSTYVHHTFSPPMHIGVIMDSLNLYGFGSDSIDIGGDGSYDLVIGLNYLNMDSLHLLGGGLPSPFPGLYLIPENGLELARCKETFYVGLGTYATAWFADSLAYGERIDTLSNWDSPLPWSTSMWQENPNNGMTPSFGAWYDLGAVRYLGIRMPGERYGWIAVDVRDRNDPVFVGYAVEI
jgi:hypothetical protein